MNFLWALAELKAGRNVRRAAWLPDFEWAASDANSRTGLVMRDLLADDWELGQVPEPEPVDLPDDWYWVRVSGEHSWRALHLREGRWLYNDPNGQSEPWSVDEVAEWGDLVQAQRQGGFTAAAK